MIPQCEKGTVPFSHPVLTPLAAAPLPLAAAGSGGARRPRRPSRARKRSDFVTLLTIGTQNRFLMRSLFRTPLRRKRPTWQNAQRVFSLAPNRRSSARIFRPYRQKCHGFSGFPCTEGPMCPYRKKRHDAGRCPHKRIIRQRPTSLLQSKSPSAGVACSPYSPLQTASHIRQGALPRLSRTGRV